jgi:integrase
MYGKLHTAVFPSGERFPSLLDPNTYQPRVIPTRYLIHEHRDSKAVGTLEKILRLLGWLFEWAESKGIDLEERLRDGKVLSVAELSLFCRYLRAKRNPILIGQINPQGEELYDVLSPPTFNDYIGIVEDFLIWSAHYFIPRNTPVNQIRENLETAKNAVEQAFESQRLGGKSAPKLGLTAEEVAQLREIIKPGADGNPFKQSVQFRNLVIIEFLLATGVRRGELLSLKLKHLPVGPKTTVTIERSPDDRADPRRNAPQVKTLGREIPVSRPLITLLTKYTQSHRKKGNHLYVFTSNRDGSPLNYGGVNNIFSTLVEKCFPHLEGRLHPHIMRHTFNDGLLEEADRRGWDEDKRRKVQTYLSGWTENSRMPDVYTRRQIALMAVELAEKYQSRLYEDEEAVF